MQGRLPTCAISQVERRGVFVVNRRAICGQRSSFVNHFENLLCLLDGVRYPRSSRPGCQVRVVEFPLPFLLVSQSPEPFNRPNSRSTLIFDRSLLSCPLAPLTESCDTKISPQKLQRTRARLRPDSRRFFGSRNSRKGISVLGWN
jgi:hypothetical protein